MNQFLSGTDVIDTMEIAKLLSSIFAASYLKENGTTATISPDIAALHAAAISAWTLLLTVMDSDICKLIGSVKSKNNMP